MMANDVLRTDGDTPATAVSGAESSISASYGFGSATQADLNSLQRSNAQVVNDDFTITGDLNQSASSSASDHDCGGGGGGGGGGGDVNMESSTLEERNDTAIDETPDATKDEECRESERREEPLLGEFQKHSLPDGNTLVLFNPLVAGSPSFHPFLSTADGQVIESHGGGGSNVSGQPATISFSYPNGANLGYRQGDSHMTYTETSGKSSTIKLEGPLRWFDR